jgi:phosphoglycolate phosphatase-like HAD superfamily hydrolase
MTTIRGVLLDMDGTLIDSNDAHARSWVEVFTRGGHSVSFERVRKMIGMGSDQLIPSAGSDKVIGMSYSCGYENTNVR